ncbi:hypothetical protein [Allokutzneria oryzae]|uniref:Uncharacterized protein n=1 Tax=Allokutzneria oryzae TaxID=1378989 RepID=A0ABV6A7Y5_9PSEU
MTEPLPITRVGTEILVGVAPEHPEQTALLEARGALLHWDVLSDAVVPAARIYDAARAADWLWEIYGLDTATAILDGAHTVEASPGESPVRDAARTVAHLTWAEAWWPASAIAEVPPLDDHVLRAEKAVATGAIDHLLDDEEATERALTAAVRVDEFADQLAELADNYGITLSDKVSSTPSREDFALAASGGIEADGVVVMRGTSPVDWALLPHAVLDAAADAAWTVHRRDGQSILQVSVPRAPAAQAQPRLAARFGPVEFPLEYLPRTVIGRTTLAPAALLLPAAQRTLTVYAPDFAGDQPQPDPGAAARRTAIIARARARVGASDATVTERSAGTT